MLAALKAGASLPTPWLHHGPRGGLGVGTPCGCFLLFRRAYTICMCLYTHTCTGTRVYVLVLWASELSRSVIYWTPSKPGPSASTPRRIASPRRRLSDLGAGQSADVFGFIYPAIPRVQVQTCKVYTQHHSSYWKNKKSGISCLGTLRVWVYSRSESVTKGKPHSPGKWERRPDPSHFHADIFSGLPWRFTVEVPGGARYLLFQSWAVQPERFEILAL